jgi:quinol monooxygenase YgiN
MHALFLKHRAKPGRRDDLEAVWRRYMMPAIEGNDGHLVYAYGFGVESDVVGAFQIYRSKEDADAFVRSAAYLAYLEESRPLLEHDPEVTVLELRWVKGG